jgi:hypothetical protein
MDAAQMRACAGLEWLVYDGMPALEINGDVGIYRANAGRLRVV